jgi:hypothetical protein
VVRSATGGSGDSTRPVYRCATGGRGHVARNAVPLDDLVRKVITARLRRPDLSDLLPSRNPSGPDPDALRAEVKTERDRLQTLAVLLGDGTLDPAGYKTASARVRERLEAAEQALTASLRRSPVAPVLATADPGAAFLAADVDVQRAVVRELFTVELLRPRPGRGPFDPHTVTITWKTS